MNKNPLNNQPLLCMLIGLTLFINIGLIFSPFLLDNDPTEYFIIAKNMALHGHWLYLFDNTGPWLDKPHFPFWITAISFKLFGYHPWSYILPGFIFYMIGSIYTYKLSKLFYNNEIIAWLSALIYMTILRLMLSSLDIRAEAYLLGQITPACYYWIKYYQETTIKHLLLGALFTAFALMTKGIFVLITIGSGIIVLGIYQKKMSHFFSIKWLSAVFFSFLFSSPEFIALYAQFGSKGIEWFFWGSQFGRFFDTGRIVRYHGSPFFFMQTFLWAFLPWSFVFISAIYDFLKNFKSLSPIEKSSFIFLSSSFFITFLVFSLSEFQVDHYTNIIFPFAAILSANYLYKTASIYPYAKVFSLQIIISIVLLIIASIVAIIAAQKGSHYFILLDIFPVLLALIMFLMRKELTLIEKAIIYPVASINIVFLIFWLMLSVISAPLSAGYVIGNYLKKQASNIPVYEYQQDTNLSVYMKNLPIITQNIPRLPLNTTYFLILSSQDIPAIIEKLPTTKIILQAPYMSTNSFVHNLFRSSQQFEAAKKSMTLLKIN